MHSVENSCMILNTQHICFFLTITIVVKNLLKGISHQIMTFRVKHQFDESMILPLSLSLINIVFDVWTTSWHFSSLPPPLLPHFPSQSMTLRVVVQIFDTVLVRLFVYWAIYHLICFDFCPTFLYILVSFDGLDHEDVCMTCAGILATIREIFCPRSHCKSWFPQKFLTLNFYWPKTRICERRNRIMKRGFIFLSLAAGKRWLCLGVSYGRRVSCFEQLIGSVGQWSHL